MQTANDRPKFKTALLTETEQTSLKNFIQSKTSLSEAAFALSLPRHVVDRINTFGKGSPENISIIRKKLKNVA